MELQHNQFMALMFGILALSPDVGELLRAFLTLAAIGNAAIFLINKYIEISKGE